MKLLINVEMNLFIQLFNRHGYVLDFSTEKFDNFTFESIGVRLCEKYDLSKGESLVEYSNDASEREWVRLFLDLFTYYETSATFLEDQSNKSNNYYHFLYIQLIPIVARVKEKINFSSSGAMLRPIKQRFNNEYINAHIDDMLRQEKENPTDAIGKSKELIEICCKTILEELNVEIENGSNIYKLVSITTDKLNLAPSDIEDSNPLSRIIRKVLQGLRSIAIGIAELRNTYGSGHGKSATFKALEERYAKLAVGSSATLVRFLWDTHIDNFLG